MSINLSSASLRELVALTEKREKLLGELSAIEVKISSALNGASSGAVERPRRGRGSGNIPSTKRGKRGAVKELILAGFKEAGEAGIAVKHLAAKLAIKPQNLHVWLHTTGKKSGLIEAAGKGIYRLKQTVGVEAPRSIVQAPKPKVARKKKATVAAKNKKKKSSVAK